MFAAPLKLSPVRAGFHGLRRLRWKPLLEQSRSNIEVDSGTLRIAGLEPIPLRRIHAVAYYAKGIGAGLEICLDAESRDDLSRLRIPARAFGSFDDASRIVTLIEQAIASHGGRDEQELREIRALCRERTTRIPWLSLWFGGTCVALTIISHFTAGGDFVLASIAHGAVVPDMIRAGEFHRLLTAGLVHGGWVHALPMILGWCLMIAIEKRAGTALVAGGFVGGGVVGYLSVVAPGGAWQAIPSASMHRPCVPRLPGRFARPEFSCSFSRSRRRVSKRTFSGPSTFVHCSAEPSPDCYCVRRLEPGDSSTSFPVTS
jgi:hypothetical protein